ASCVKSMAWMRATAQPCRHRGAKRVNEAWISPGCCDFCRQTERHLRSRRSSLAQISVVRRIFVVRRVEKGSIVIVRTVSHTHHLQALVDEEVRRRFPCAVARSSDLASRCTALSHRGAATRYN